MAKSIAILVGKSASKIRFNHNIKLRRAINAETLERMIDKVDFAIIEEISSKDEEQIKVIIQQFKFIGKSVYFFPDITDDVTLGIADELEYNIYSSLNTLCSVIESEQGIKVSTGYSVANDIDYSNDFGQTDEMSEVIRELEETDRIENSGSFESTDSMETFNGFESMQAQPVQNKGYAKNTETEPISIPEVSPEELLAELENLPDSVSNEINKLKMQLSDLNYDYSLAVEDMRVATERISNLEKIIITLKDEKECMQTEFNSLLQTNEVLEDPISLSVYQRTVDELANRDKQVNELEEKVESLKQTVESDKISITEKVTEIKELNDKLSNIEDELGAINDSISSGEIHKDIVANFTEKLENIKSEKDAAIKEANKLKIKASSDASTIGLLNKNLALETEYRYSSVELFMGLIDRLNSKIAELNDALLDKTNIENSLESSENNSKKLASSLDEANAKIEELSQLETKLVETERQLELKKSELESMNATLLENQEAISNYSEQLSNKELELSQANESIAELRMEIKKNAEDSKNEFDRAFAEREKEHQAGLDALNTEINTLTEQNKDKDTKINDQLSKIASLEHEIDNNKLEIEDLSATIDSLNSVIETKDAQIETKDGQISEKESVINNLTSTVAEKDKVIKTRDYTIVEKDRELAVKADDIQALKDSISILEAKYTNEIKKQSSTIDELNHKVDELNATITNKDYTIGIQSVAIEERENDIEQLRADIENAKRNSELLEAKVRRADERFRSTLERLKISGGDIEKLMAETQSALSTEDAQKLNDKLQQAESELAKANSALKDLNDKYNESVTQLESSVKELEVKNEEVAAANVSVQQLKSTVEQLENEIATLETVKSGVSSDEVEAIKNQNNTLVEKNSALTDQLNESLTNEATHKRLIARMESELETYKSLVAELQSDAGNSGSQCTIGGIKYNRGAIISTFSNRSCGITTLAVSIARKLSLNTNVLYIDFDMIAPKGDVIFKRTPIVEVRGAKNTSLGAMSAFGGNLTASEIKSLAVNVEKTKGGRLDYYSGYHYKPADNVIANTDFNKMFDVLGENYDYIIVDLGKIGASTFNNSIIKEIVAISKRSIAISNHDFFNIKALLRTLNIVGLNHRDIAWAINKVPESQNSQSMLSLVNPKIMELLTGCKVGAFADDLKLRGLPLDFSAGSRSNKITFEMFLAQTVFG